MSKHMDIKLVPAISSINLSAITVGGNLDIADVLTVVTSRAEDFYKDNMKQCRTESDAAAKEAETLQVEFNRLLSEEGSVRTKNVERLDAAVALFGGSVKFSSNVTYNSETREITSSLLVCDKPQDANRHASSLTLSVKVKASKDLQESYAKIQAASARAKGKQAEAVNWKAKLGDIPALERRYKAHIAAGRLQAMEGGKELLAALSTRLEDELAGLLK